MESTAGLIKLSRGHEKDLEEWRETLQSRKAEALEALKREHVELECWFEIEIEGEPYLLWFIRVESMEKARELYASSPLDIDTFHKAKMDKLIDHKIEANLLLEFQNITPPPNGQPKKS